MHQIKLFCGTPTKKKNNDKNNQPTFTFGNGTSKTQFFSTLKTSNYLHAIQRRKKTCNEKINIFNNLGTRLHSDCNLGDEIMSLNDFKIKLI